MTGVIAKPSILGRYEALTERKKENGKAVCQWQTTTYYEYGGGLIDPKGKIERKRLEDWN